MSEYILKTTNLTKTYKGYHAVNNVSIALKPGKIYGLVGRNGAGKSTLLKSLIHKIPLIRGDVHLGANVSIGYYDQTQSDLHSTKTILKELWDEHPTTPEVEIRTILGSFLFSGEDVEKPITLLSGGEKARVALAKLAMDHDNFLILDEPINGLDPIGIKEFRLMIQRLNQEKGITILISSHILSELYLVANRFGILDQGKVIREISKAEFETLSEDYIVLKAADKEKACQVLKEQIQLQFKVVNPENEIHIFGQEQDVKQILKELTLADVAIDEIYYARQNLEEYFTQLVE